MSDSAPTTTSGEPSSLRLALTLAFAGLMSGLILVGVYQITLPRILANKAAALRKAVFEVVPGSTTMKKMIVSGDALVPAAEHAKGEAVYAAFDEKGRFRGYAVPGEGSGFQDTIRLIYGFDPVKRRIIGLFVLESRETPGLGDKIVKDADFLSNFDALAVEPEIKVVKKGKKTKENEVDAITGATISSKSVVKIVNATNRTWLPRLTGAPEES